MCKGVKYQNVPELYGKPLKIVCVAYQEEELTNGKTKYFGNNITNLANKINGPIKNSTYKRIDSPTYTGITAKNIQVFDTNGTLSNITGLGTYQFLGGDNNGYGLFVKTGNV